LFLFLPLHLRCSLHLLLFCINRRDHPIHPSPPTFCSIHKPTNTNSIIDKPAHISAWEPCSLSLLPYPLCPTSVFSFSSSSNLLNPICLPKSRYGKRSVTSDISLTSIRSNRRRLKRIESCESLGFIQGGALACGPGCQYDTSGCCGDGVLGDGEECDGEDFGGLSTLKMVKELTISKCSPVGRLF
jgi:hypothetical protein